MPDHDAVAHSIVEGSLSAVREWLASSPTLEKLTLTGPDGYGWTPLQLAAFAQTTHRGTLEVTRLIVEASSPEQQSAALTFFASEDKYLPQARALLDAGVPVDVATAKGGTALMLAAGNGNPKQVQLFLERGADPRREGPYGSALKTASSSALLSKLMNAALEGHPTCLFALHELDAVRATITAKARDVRAFLLAHPDQTFFAIAFEGGRVKANSEQAFAAALARARAEFPGEYATPEKVDRLRYNPGDFAFVVPAAKDAHVPALDFACLAQRGPSDDRTVRDLLVEAFELNRALVLTGLNVAPDLRFQAGKHVY